jgi:hypothetical protein
MSWETEHDGEAAYLRSQLNALATKPRKVRERFQRLVVRCKACGDVVIEVLELDPYLVLVQRQSESTPVELPPDGSTSEERKQHWRGHFEARRPTIRLDKRWRFVPISEAPDEHERSLVFACRCSAERMRTWAWLRTQLASGTRYATV